MHTKVSFNFAYGPLAGSWFLCDRGVNICPFYAWDVQIFSTTLHHSQVFFRSLYFAALYFNTLKTGFVWKSLLSLLTCYILILWIGWSLPKAIYLQLCCSISFWKCREYIYVFLFLKVLANQHFEETCLRYNWKIFIFMRWGVSVRSELIPAF